jgi:hypothetical protein
VNPRRILHVNDCFHDQLYLNGQRLVLFFVHVLFIHTIDVNLLAWSDCFEQFLLGQFFLFFFRIKVCSGLFLVHVSELLFESVFILGTSDGMALFFELRVVHVMFEFLDFFDVFLCAWLFVGHVLLVEDELGESFLGQIFHLLIIIFQLLYFFYNESKGIFMFVDKKNIWRKTHVINEINTFFIGFHQA